MQTLVRILLTLGVFFFGVITCATPSARAQIFGISSLLNPEGSRLFPDFLVAPRRPGKPDLRWRTFNWRYTDITTRPAKYRLYFYEEETWTAQFAIPQINAQIQELTTVFKYAPSKDFIYLLFSSQRDFQQANIFNISEGVQGVTSTTESTMAIPYWGELETFRHISAHELVHQFQVQKFNDLAGGMALDVMGSVPLWFIEGMAEYYSLHGIDAETRMYVRDILLHPDRDGKMLEPKFFDEMPLNFVGVYKLGQVKIAYLESIRPGVTQTLIEEVSKSPGRTPAIFSQVVARVLGITAADVETNWQTYLQATYKVESDQLSQSMDALPEIKEVGTTLDSYAVSPSEDIIAVREIDELTGVTSINLLDPKNNFKRTRVISDRGPDALTLYFMQRPGLSLSDRHLVYIVEQVSGPQLMIQEVKRRSDGELELGPRTKIALNYFALSQASSPTISPDEKTLAFIGVDQKGWQNIYFYPLEPINGKQAVKQLTTEYYSWRNLHWNNQGILAASDRTPDSRYNIFQFNPANGDIKRLTFAQADQFFPDGTPSRFVFQSWQSGSSQLHLFEDGKETRITDVKTQLVAPQLRKNHVYALGFRGGRFHLYRFSKKDFLSKSVSSHPKLQVENNNPWTPTLSSLPPQDIIRYKPFSSSGTRIDYIFGALGTGGIGGLSAGVSDLMRNYSVAGDFYSFGSLGVTNADVFFSSGVGRTKWTLGGYHIVQPALDNIFSPQDLRIRTYLRREFGAVGALQHPLGAFTFVDAELRVAGVSRKDFSDPNLVTSWEAQNPRLEPVLVPIFRLGYDTILYELFTGPLRGFGILLESDTSFFPKRGDLAQRLRLDTGYYFKLPGRTTLALQSMLGASWGDRFNTPFLVSSDDIMRAYTFGDDRLFGNYMVLSNAELRFPIGSLFGFDPLRGLVAYDLGSIFLNPNQIGLGVASAWSLGLTFNLPPLSLNFIHSVPIRTAAGLQENYVFHFTLRYLYF